MSNQTGIYEQGRDTRELFRVEICGDRYFAVRDGNPKFALGGFSATDVANQAVKALALKEKRNIIERDEWDKLLSEQKKLEEQIERYRLPSQQGHAERLRKKLFELNHRIRAVDGVIGIDA